MKKHIAIIFPASRAGGVHQYALSIAENLATYIDSFQYTIIHYQNEKPKIFTQTRKTTINYVGLKSLNAEKGSSALIKTLHYVGLATGLKSLLIKSPLEKLAKKNFDLLIYPTPLTFCLPGDLPYIVTIPDLMHKYYPQFPDYGWINNRKRDIVYSYYARYSLLNTVDSQQGGDDIVKFLKTPKEKNRVIPYIPANYIYQYKEMTLPRSQQLLKRYHLPSQFLFYPAQFWYQKNHFRLIKALHLIKTKQQTEIPLVLVGNSQGSYAKIFQAVMKLVRALKIENQINHLGYVSNEEMVALYKTATALIAPPLQGPTTLLPLEALVLGTPILTTNIFDLPKQVGEAGLLFDPLDVEDMAQKIYTLWKDPGLPRKLVERGRERAQNINPQHFARQWEATIDEAVKYEQQQKYRNNRTSRQINRDYNSVQLLKPRS